MGARSGGPVKAEPRHYAGFVGAGRFDAERKRPLTESSGSAVATSGAEAPDGLDWQTFSAACFPGRRRHDLEALTAYSAYKRSRDTGARSSAEPARIETWRRAAGATALRNWEDEGGATLSPDGP